MPENPLSSQDLRDITVNALEDMKGRRIVVMDVTGVTDIADYMIVASGSSNRHVKALVDRVVEYSKAAGQKSGGVEGKESLEWVLLDLGDVIVHVMQEQSREFYDLESLWLEFSPIESNL